MPLQKERAVIEYSMSTNISLLTEQDPCVDISCFPIAPEAPTPTLGNSHWDAITTAPRFVFHEYLKKCAATRYNYSIQHRNVTNEGFSSETSNYIDRLSNAIGRRRRGFCAVPADGTPKATHGAIH